MKFVNNCKVAHQYIKKALYHIFTKHLFLALAILFFIFSSVYYFASRAPALNTPPDWQNANSIGGTGADRAQSVAKDSAGNSYVTGSFEDTITIDTTPTTTLTLNGSSDIFVAKYDSSGDAIWAVSYGTEAIDIGHGIIIDKTNGYVYVVGETADNLFARRFSIADGALDSVIYSGSSKIGQAITIGPDGSIYVSGYFVKIGRAHV